MTLGSGNEEVLEAERCGVAGRQPVKVNLGTRKIHAWECIQTAWA